MNRLWLGVFLVALLGCDDDEALELSVDLRTDFVAGAEFSGVRVELVGEGVSETDVAQPVSYVDGRRIFDLDGLEANERRVVAVSLLDPMSAVVARREVLVAQSADLAVTVVMTRDCASVSCPAAAGESETSCLGGRCVDPRCVEGDEEVCLEPLCESDAECTPMNPCAAPVCQVGVCLYEGLDGCEAGTYCDPARGCVPIAGPTDGGPGPAAPAVVYPPQGAATGSVHAAASADLAIRWTYPTDPDRFELELDDSCPVEGYADCAFPSPEDQSEIAGSVREVSRTLAVATAVPVGTRYTYRLRACTAAACSPWTRPRHVGVGRLGSDLDGDGYDEVTIGARHLLHIADGGSRSLMYSDIANPFPDGTSGFGRAISAGDIDGDGFVDLVVGAPFDRGFGSVAIFRGGASGPTLWTQIQGPAAVALNGQFGRTVCITDVDGDGNGDVLTDTISSGAFLIRGVAGDFAAAEAITLDGGIRDCADLDRDGYGDVLVGSAFHPGGPSGLGAAIALDEPASFYLGDLSGDRLAEYAAIGRGSFPLLWSRPGQLVGPSSTVTASLFPFEWQVRSIANDIDGDGFGDTPLGDAGASSGDPGAAAVLFGAADPASARVEPLPSCGGCRMGSAVAAGLDVDGDGLADFAIGAPSESFVDVWFGGTTDPLPSVRLSGGDGFGTAL